MKTRKMRSGLNSLRTDVILCSGSFWCVSLAFLMSGRKRAEATSPAPIMAVWSQITARHDVYVTMIPAMHGPMRQSEVSSSTKYLCNFAMVNSPKAGPKTVPTRKKPVAVPLWVWTSRKSGQRHGLHFAGNSHSLRLTHRLKDVSQVCLSGDMEESALNSRDDAHGKEHGHSVAVRRQTRAGH